MQQRSISELAARAMVVEVACDFGGQSYILRVAKNLTANHLKEFLLEAVSAVVGAVDTI